MKTLASQAAAVMALAILGFTLLSPCRTLAAEDPLLLQSQRQEQIRTSASKVGQQLDQILSDFDLNGISGEDVKVLKAIRGVLGKLTEDEMGKVVQLLKDARQKTAEGQTGVQVAEAFSGQRNIITQLRQLLLEYQRQQAIYEIAVRLKELAGRQAENMRLAVWLSRQVDRKALEQFQETQRLNLQLQETEQGSLRSETDLILQQLERVVKDTGEGQTSARPTKALEQAKEGGLIPALDTSLLELKSGKLISAAGNEKRARDQMREVARLLTQSLDRKDALREALRELDENIDKQQAAMEATRKLQNREETTKREAEQAEVVDNTDLIRRDLQDLAPAAAEHLHGATERMQEARSALLNQADPKKARDKAFGPQNDAMAKLEQARRELLDQLAQTESPPPLPKDALAAVKELQKRINELMEKQAELKTNAAASSPEKLAALAPKQGDLKDKAQETQASTSPLSPAAADALNEAANQMQKSQKGMAESQNQPAAQQAAMDALARASQELEQDRQRLEQAAKELAEMEEMLKKLVAIITEQQDLHAATAQAAIRPDPQPNAGSVGTQFNLSQRTESLQTEAAKNAPKAANHLGNAQEQMLKAHLGLQKPDPAAAQKDQSAALKALYAARNELEKGAKERQDQLNPEDQEEQSGDLSDVEKAIEKALKDVNEAMADMQQGAANALQTLRERQRQLAKDLTQPMLEGPFTTPAQREADIAAQKLDKADVGAAIEAMKATLGSTKKAVESGQPRANEGAPTMPALSEQQAELLAMAQSLEQSMKNAPEAAMKKASKALNRASKRVQPYSAGQLGRVPRPVRTELEAAQEDLDNASAQAGEQQGQPAQMNAQNAAQHLAQAQAALALAQAGLSSNNQNQQAANSSGKGKKPGQGNTKRGAQSQPGPQGDGREGNWRGPGGTDGAQNDASGSSSRFTGLPARDRAAIQQSQGESYPQEYAPLVEQYLRNLADQAEP